MSCRFFPRLSKLVWLLPAVALAAIVSSSDITQAIQNSPNASAWLKQNAQAVANLAINVESGGNTSAFNGSCCYGVLQMNRTNIAKYAGVTPEQYRQLPLQAQIDAWSQLTADAMRSGVVRQLIGLGTFDGRAVDGNLVLACVQLGIGNCQRMINSGSCRGFADSNGTSICDMAARMANGRPTNPGNTNPPGNGSGSTGGNGGTGLSGNSCPRDVTGACMEVSAAMQQGFLQGSGIQMPSLKQMLLAGSGAFFFLVTASAFSGLYGRYTSGRVATGELVHYLVKGTTTLLIGLLALSML